MARIVGHGAGGPAAVVDGHRVRGIGHRAILPERTDRGDIRLVRRGATGRDAGTQPRVDPIACN